MFGAKRWMAALVRYYDRLSGLTTDIIHTEDGSKPSFQTSLNLLMWYNCSVEFIKENLIGYYWKIISY